MIGLVASIAGFIFDYKKNKLNILHEISNDYRKEVISDYEKIFDNLNNLSIDLKKYLDAFIYYTENISTSAKDYSYKEFIEIHNKLLKTSPEIFMNVRIKLSILGEEKN